MGSYRGNDKAIGARLARDWAEMGNRLWMRALSSLHELLSASRLAVEYATRSL
jgi:hypothetical protein